ncbi:MAG: hypothetical protein DLM58_00360 [Pseudonocardiales bacterium]|nr:MAG: hypothetical protein DLM58_00360 [Pseudonocardiales bacterium]
MELLAGFRPTNEQLEHDWPAAERVVMRETIQATNQPAGTTRFAARMHRPRKPWPAIAGLVGAAAAALLVVQIMQPSQTTDRPDAATQAKTKSVALQKLVLAAQATPADDVHPGQFRHLVVTQTDGLTVESWTAFNGDLWQRRDDQSGSPSSGTVEYWNMPHTWSSISPQSLAALPTDTDGLQRYLLSHVCGSSSRDEAMFVGVADMLRGDYAPTALRVAAIHVLERTGHVTTHQSQDAQGHPALQVDFIDHSIRAGETQSLFFDPNTSALLQEQINGGGMDFTATYSASSTATRVPADVLAKAVRQEDHADPVPSVTPSCTWDK